MLNPEEQRRLNGITYEIIGAAIRVEHGLGTGFLEKIYENALVLELRESGLEVRQQCELEVSYRGRAVGAYYADLLVERAVIVEIKAASGLAHAHYRQCVHYLAATGCRVCLLLNFGPTRLEYRRIVRGF